MTEDALQKLVVVVTPTEAEAFWLKCDRTGGAEACWPYTKSLTPNGYGLSKYPQYGSKRVEKAHRVAFLIANGWLPQGRTRGSLIVRHACDNRPCCNPAHLLIGTHQQNSDDACERGRAVLPPVSKLDAHPRAKLSVTAAREARCAHAHGASCASLARRFAVGETTMGHLLAGRTWREISDAV